METTSKPGWKKSEFWLTILTNIITIVGSLQGVIPPETAAIILAVVNAIYSVLRTIAYSTPTPIPNPTVTVSTSSSTTSTPS